MKIMHPRRMATAAFLCGFALFCLEPAAARRLAVLLGTTAGAWAVVLSGILGGMGLGAWAAGRLPLAGRLGRSAISWNQSAGAAWMAMLPFLLPLLVTGRLPWAAEAAIAWLLLSGAGLFLGAILPLLYRSTAAEGDRGTRTGRILGWNTLGGVAGVLTATFLLIPRLGITASFFTGAVLFLSAIPIAAGPPLREPARLDRPDAPSPFLLPAAAALLGFLGMALETNWMRLLAVYLPNRHTAFGLTLAAYLAGYGLGCLWGGRLSRREGRAAARLTAVLGGLAVLALATIPLSVWGPDLLFRFRSLLLAPWRQIWIPPLMLSGLLVLPSAFLMGTLLPLLVALHPGRKEPPGGEMGTLYGLNTLGAVLGAPAAAFLLMPAAGPLRSILLIGIAYGVLALATRRAAGDAERTRAGLWVTAAVALTAGALFLHDHLPKPLPISVFRDAHRSDRLLFHRDAVEGTIAVVEDARTGVRWSYINNSAVCGTTYDALKVVRMLAHLPLLASPDAGEVLVVGFGLGVTARHVLAWPVERVDCVELCPEIAGAAPLYEAYNRGVLEDPRVRLIPGDGRQWLLRNDRSYDVITCDPTHPALGSGNLYTREYFELVRRRLKPGGRVAQYLPLRWITAEDLQRAAATFRRVFPESSLWLGHAHAILLGGTEPLRVDPGDWDRNLERLPVRQDLLRSGLARSADWLALLLMEARDLEAWTADVPPVTDDRPVLEYPAGASLHPFTWSANMEELLAGRNRKALDRLLAFPAGADPEFVTLLDRFFEARTLFMRASILKGRGELEMAASLAGEARRTNWDDAEIRLFHETWKNEAGRMRIRAFFEDPRE